jgi:hypothetical protein
MKSESIKNIAAAINAVMQEVRKIDKTMTVGTGANSYKGVSDESVKIVISESMVKHGLSIVPIGVTANERIERWEENGRNRQQIFNSVITTYLLMHTSGEWLELAGHGHGTDTQDKSAGKATTYALKYTLLYTFMVATSRIDDADNTHSDNHEVLKRDNRPWLNTSPTSDNWGAIVAEYKANGWVNIEAKYKVNKATKQSIENN